MKNISKKKILAIISELRKKAKELYATGNASSVQHDRTVFNKGKIKKSHFY